jgi:hypothetical protein
MPTHRRLAARGGNWASSRRGEKYLELDDGPIDLPGAKWTGVTLRVKGRPGDDVLVVDVVVV